LRDKFYATDATNGTPGEYTRPDGASTTWTKQNGGDSIPTFTSLAAFKTWLDGKPNNTAAVPYSVKMNVSTVYVYDPSTSTSISFQGVLQNAPNKYVSLDLSDSTFTQLNSDDFYGCTSLVSIIIPASVTAIMGNGVFPGCTNLVEIKVAAGNTAYTAENGVLYDIGKTLLLQYPLGKTDVASFTLPNTVNRIYDSAFRNCTGLTSITIPNSVTHIDQSAFSNCTANITVPDSVTNFGSSFSGCTGSINITIGNIPNIPYGAFSGCSGLTSITIPSSVTSIGDSAFSGSGLTSIIIPSSVDSIGQSAFYNCTDLTSVTFEGTIPSTGFLNYGSFGAIFPGDLRTKFYAAPNITNGTPGTYTTTAPVISSSVWTKQP